MEKSRVVAVREGLTAVIEVYKYPGFEEIRGSIRLCGLDDEDKPFRLTLHHERLETLMKTLEDLIVELTRAEEAEKERR